MSIEQDYFTVFGLPQSFDIDLADLSSRYRKLQREVHPDRYADGNDREKLLAVQYASYINQAYGVLKSLTSRADYLLKLKGVEPDDSDVTTTDGQFLMQQMELREQVTEIKEQSDPEAALEALTGDVDKFQSELSQEFTRLYEAGDYHNAQSVVAKLHFIKKLAVEIDRIEAELLDY